ncbi:MAG: hypothetical protein OES09_00020 [Gammaproteobacteria bacterium]|nr:hypothetical protein [Gammaproteobacteria bacterium]
MSEEQKERYVASKEPFNGPDRELLARLDERMDFVLKQMPAMIHKPEFDALRAEIEGLIKVIKEDMKTKVSKSDFAPVRGVVYSIVGSIGLGVIFSWLWVVLIHPSP